MIEFNHSSTVITGYTMGDSGKLEKSLGAWDPATFSVKWANYYYDEQNKRLFIPRGFPSQYLGKLLPDHGMKTNKKADISKTAVFKMRAEPRDSEQEDSIDFLLAEGKFKDTSDYSQRMLAMKTGGGKTFCTITSLSEIRKRSMIIADRDKTVEYWKSEFLKFTDISEKEIYIIRGRESMEKVMKSSRDLPYKVFIASHRTIASYAGDDWTRITEFFKNVKIGVKVFDEAHVEVKNIFMIDSYTNTENTFYLTATPFRSNPNEDKVYQNSFQEVPKHGLEEKFNDPYLYTYYVSYDSKPPAKIVAQCTTRRGFDVKLFSDYTFEHRYDQYVDTITTLIDLAINKKGKIAILTSKNDHILKLSETLKVLYPDTEIGIFTSLIKNKKERDEQLDKKIIISTEKSLGKATDVSMLRFFIMTVPTSSKTVADQASGRLRKIPNMKSFYFDVTDVGFASCVNQRKSRRAPIDSKSISIKNLNL